MTVTVVLKGVPPLAAVTLQFTMMFVGVRTPVAIVKFVGEVNVKSVIFPNTTFVIFKSAVPFCVTAIVAVEAVPTVVVSGIVLPGIGLEV